MRLQFTSLLKTLSPYTLLPALSLSIMSLCIFLNLHPMPHPMCIKVVKSKDLIAFAIIVNVRKGISTARISTTVMVGKHFKTHFDVMAWMYQLRFWLYHVMDSLIFVLCYCVYLGDDQSFTHVLMQRMGSLLEKFTQTGNDAVGRSLVRFRHHYPILDKTVEWR